MVVQSAVLDELRAMGSEQTRKTYAKHGVAIEQFGDSYAHLGALKKRIKIDHDLACALWDSGIHDARVLATMIADPLRADATLLDAWARDLGNYTMADAVSGFVARTPLAVAKMGEWLDSDDEWHCTTGWNLLGLRALQEPALPDDYFIPYLDRIARDLHGSKNRVRYAMNNALIAIGSRSAELARLATDAAARIGKVHVDHGATSCKTPDAATAIQKARARKKS